MPELSANEIVELGKQVGLEIEGSRARTIADRLTGIIEELDEIPDELIESVEPSHRFDVERE